MNKNLPLSNIVVLDLTNVLSGPFATQILSDLGAEIIKVEKPNGDDSRKFGPFIKKKSSYFISLNRGKKSIIIDFKNEEDKKIFKKLLTISDVIIDNFKPGTLEKYGFSSSYLKKNFPSLIQTKISGFGETGPLKANPAYDMIVQAMGGIMSITGKNKNETYRVGSSIGDIVAGLYAVIGVLTQIIFRNQSKKGSRLDLSMLDCQVAILENAIARYSVEKKIPSPLGTDHPSITPFGAFKTLDGTLAIAIGNNKMFKDFCCSIKNEELYKKKKYKNNAKRNKNLSDLRRDIEYQLKKKKTNYWCKVFVKNKIPHSKINNIKDVIKNAQVENRKMVLDYNFNTINNLKISGNPLKFSFMNINANVKKSPDLNENKSEILKKIK
ncbi:MAG: carnitine dehydratase [Rickettsiales bacterium]|nr:carnitine dehydratase [Rickettsiales bacterium]